MTSGSTQQRVKTGCIILVVLHVLALIFWFTGGISASAFGESVSIDYKDAFEYADEGAFYYLPMITTLIALVCAALPISQGTKGKGLLTVSLVLDIITFLYCTLIIILVMSEAKDQSYGLASYSPTFIGILHFIVGLAMIVYQFVVKKAMDGAIAEERSGAFGAGASYGAPISRGPVNPGYTGYAPPAAPSAPTAASAPRFCAGCGAPLTPGSSFCGSCGMKN